MAARINASIMILPRRQVLPRSRNGHGQLHPGTLADGGHRVTLTRGVHGPKNVHAIFVAGP